MNKNAANIEGIANLFRDSLNIDVSSADTDLIDEGLLDSLMLVELLMHLEQQYQISIGIEDLELENFRTIRSIEQFIDSRQAA